MSDQPIWEWSLEQVQMVTRQAHAGADLTPTVWPNGAQVAVALWFDFDGDRDFDDDDD